MPTPGALETFGGIKILDYLDVKQFHAKKLAEDAEGGGRVESAFYHTMRFVYAQGVEDGRSVRPEVGIVDHGVTAANFAKCWLETDTFIGSKISSVEMRKVRDMCAQFFRAGDRYRLLKENKGATTRNKEMENEQV